MRLCDYPHEVRDVVEMFSRETGIPMRLISDMQARQAMVFAENFALWELRVTIRWVLARIRAQEGGEERTGMTRLSLQWHCMFGSDGDLSLAPFQQRLGLAMTWAAKAAPKLIQKPVATPLALPAAPGAPVRDDAEERAERARLVKDLESKLFPSKGASDG